MTPRGHQANGAQRLERAIDALRRVWVGGPQAGADLILALDELNGLRPLSPGNDITRQVEHIIVRLRNLPRSPEARKQEIATLGQALKALQPAFGTTTAELGKLNATVGERRVGRPSPAKAHRRPANIHPVEPEAMLTSLPGIGSSSVKPLNDGLHLVTVEDLLQFLPRRHIDYAHPSSIGDPLTLQGEITLRGKLVDVRVIRAQPQRLTARLFDGTGSIQLTWFSTFIHNQLQEGSEIVVAGSLSAGRGGFQLTNPEWEFADRGKVLTQDTLIPVYPLTKGISQKTLRKHTRNALDATKTTLLDWLADAREVIDADLVHELPPVVDMYEHLHYPETRDQFEAAHRRLVFENLFLLQLGLVQTRATAKRAPGKALAISADDLEALVSRLPFALTNAQQRVVREIRADLQQPVPMTRLVQGDVGSGKTVVAAIAAWIALANGMQTAIMAPTELLAEQHATSFARLFDALPEDRRPRLALLTGSTRAAARREILAGLETGDIDILIGTHALIQDDVEFATLGLVVIDEQHRFGVNQRAALSQKAIGFQPHVLSMTATPIPRTLNLVVHGDLDVSIIDERPPGRIPITTIAYVGAERAQAYDLVRREVRKGHQVFVICPLVEESDTIEAKAAVAEADRLQRDIFPDLRVDVLHGKMSGKQKDDIMSRFRDHEFDILVSTSVIEVGIDIPNASVMMIEGAERFGLAQLHQFRGRVGRGGTQSYCLLLSDEATADSNARLQTMVATDDGFVLAERDLQLRGPGDIIGTRQSGLPELGVLEQGFDGRLLDKARESAERLLAASPTVDDARYPRLKRRLIRFWHNRPHDSAPAS